jgi:hypothetical protein
MGERSPGVSGTCKGVFYSVSGSSYHEVEIQLQVILLPKDSAIRIDKLPFRGAPTFPDTLDFSSSTKPSSKINTTVALPRLNREVSTLD